jgi:hypothetical protein
MFHRHGRTGAPGRVLAQAAVSVARQPLRSWRAITMRWIWLVPS